MRHDHPIHRAWAIQQAAIEHRRMTAEINAYANLNPAARDAAQKVRETLAEKRRERTKEAE